MILPKIRDKRFTTFRRGGTLSDEHHRLLALWAAQCADHVLPLFENARVGDDRPRKAIEATQAWVRGEITMTESKVAAYHSNVAARDIASPAKLAALSAGQAAVVAHVAAHYLGAAAYAIRAVLEANGTAQRDEAGRAEWMWQLEKLPVELRDLVLEDQKNRNDICWNVFRV